MITLTDEQKKAVDLLRDARLDTDQGMPEELFLLVSALVPITNIDLLVVNRRGQLLLSRRNDPYYENGWHIPGGCMRFHESFERRIQETAKRELGCTVSFDETPLAVRNVIRGERDSLSHPRERSHNTAILFRCSLPDDYQIDNGLLTEADNGYLKWFDTLPSDFLKLQLIYSDILQPWLPKA